LDRAADEQLKENENQIRRAFITNLIQAEIYSEIKDKTDYEH
jgi:hypothetical protein